MDEIISIFITAIFTLITVWFKDYYIKRKFLKSQPVPIDKSEIYLKLMHICGDIKKDLAANGVFIAYFHNGDYFKNGLSIEKFTVVAEDYDESINISYISSYANKPIQYITYLYHRLLTDGRCYKPNIDSVKVVDSAYKQDCISRNVKSTYSFLIKDANEKPIGFISVEYTTITEFKKENESFIWKHQISTSKNINNFKSK